MDRPEKDCELMNAKREIFYMDAISAWENYQITGLHVTWKEADQWLDDLVKGNYREPPKAHR